MDIHEDIDEQTKLEMTDCETQITDLNSQLEISENIKVDIEDQKDNTLPNVIGDSETVSDLYIEKNTVSAVHTEVNAEEETHFDSDIPNHSLTDNTSTVPIDNTNAEKDIPVVAWKEDANIEEECNAADDNTPAELAEEHHSHVIEHQSHDAAFNSTTVENMNQHVNIAEQMTDLEPQMTDWDHNADMAEQNMTDWDQNVNMAEQMTDWDQSVNIAEEMTDVEPQITNLNNQKESSENMEIDIKTEKDKILPNVDGDLNNKTCASELHDSEAVSTEKNVSSAEETVDMAEPETHSVSDIPNQSVTDNTSTVPIDNKNAEKDVAIVASEVNAKIEKECNTADTNSLPELAEKHHTQVIDTDKTNLPPQVSTEDNAVLPTNITKNSTKEAAVDNTDNSNELEINDPASCDIILSTDQIKVEQQKSVFNSYSDEISIKNLVNRLEQQPKKWDKAKEMYHNALLKFLGCGPDAGDERLIEFANLMRKKLPLCEFPFVGNHSPCIFTSNWPTWINAHCFRRLLKVLTDFDYEHGVYLIEGLLYNDRSRMGALLLRFGDKEDCKRVYSQLRVVTLLNPKIKVELDMGNFILNQTVGSKKWRDPNRRARHRITCSGTTIPPPENYQEDPHPNPNAKNMKTRKEAESGVPIPSITPTTPGKKIFDLTLIAITKIQDLLGIKPGSLIQNKLEVEQKVKHKRINVTTPVPCNAIYMSNCPYQFEIEHYRFVLRLLTNFDWNKGIYYIEVLQYSNGANMGAIHIKFASCAVCARVYQELSRVSILQKGMPLQHRIRVQLDLHGNIAKVRKTGEPPFDWLSPMEPKCRARSVVTHIPAQRNCPDIIRTFILTKHNKKRQFQQTVMAEQQPKQVAEDDDDIIILQAQSVPEIDLTEDDESFRANNELMDIGFDSKIEQNDENSDATTFSASTSSQSRTATPLNKKSGNMDTTDSDTCKVVHVKSLPVDKTITKLKDLIDQHTKFDMKRNMFLIKLLRETGTNKSLGECLMEFNTHAEAVDVASSLDGVFIENNIVQAELDIGNKVSKANELDKNNAKGAKRKLNSEGQHGEPKRAKFDDTWEVIANNRWNTRYGLNKEFFVKIGCKLPLTNFIIVKNLEKNVTEDKLVEVFSLAGKVKQVTLSNEQDKNSARIEYDHPVETVQAVSMFNHQKLYDTEMLVSNDNSAHPDPLPQGLSAVGPGLGKHGEPIRDVRTDIELQKVYEILYEMGRMNKYENKDQVFQARYTKRHNPPPVNTAIGTKPNTAIALEALGAVLVSLDIIPSGTDCSDLNKIIEALSKNPAFKQNPQQSSHVQQAAASTSNMAAQPQIYYSSKPKPNAKRNQNPNLTIIPTNKPPPKPPTSNPNTDTNMQNRNPNFNPSVPPPNLNMPGINTTKQPATHVAPNMQAVALGAPMQSSAHGAPNMHSAAQWVPNMQPASHGPPNMQSVMHVDPNTQPATQWAPNMQPAAHGAPNMQPAAQWAPNMQPAAHGAQNMQPTTHGTPNMQSAAHGAPNMQSPAQWVPNMQPTTHGDPNMQSATYGAQNMQSVAPQATNMQPASQGAPNMQPVYVDSNMQPIMHVNPNMQPVMYIDPNMQQMMHANPNMQQMVHVNPNMQPVMHVNPANYNMSTNPNNSTVWGANYGNVPPNPSPHPPLTPISPSNPVISAQTLVTSTSPNDHVITTASNHKEKSRTEKGSKKDKEPTRSSTKSNLVSFHNLPSSVTTSALAAKMKEIGPIQFSECIGNGRALVRFKELSAAERCIRLFHRSKVDGNTIDVSII